MKVWIDKQGGNHYHKQKCLMLINTPYHYEEVEHRIMRELQLYLYSEYCYKPAIIDNKRYYPCPICFKGRNMLLPR